MARPKYGAAQPAGQIRTTQQPKPKRTDAKQHLVKKSQKQKRKLSHSPSLEDDHPQPSTKRLKKLQPTESHNNSFDCVERSESRKSERKEEAAVLDSHKDIGTSPLPELGSPDHQEPEASGFLRGHQPASPTTDLSSPPAASLEQTPSELSVGDVSHSFILFGTLVSLNNAKFSVHLRGSADGSTTFVVGGSGPCDIKVPGAGKRQCMIVLELQHSGSHPLRRIVEIRRIDTMNKHIQIKSDGVTSELGQSAYLSNGDRISFGYGNWYEYRAPMLPELYRAQTPLYGYNQPNPNSRVSRVVRLSDGVPMVVKTITSKCERWARTELAALKTIGYHRNVVRFIEAFSDQSTSETHIILEPADTDLNKYVPQMRSKNPSALTGQRTRIIAELSSAVAYLHSLNLAHRDIKPQNILISFVGTRKVTVKLCDFGLVRLNSRTISENGWRAGTLHWTAPRSFMIYPADDRLVDCYGVGRILHFTLTACHWPDESETPAEICGCPKLCKGTCVEREKTFKTLEKAKVGKHCLSFLKGLLVAMPEQCIEISEVLKHPYIKSAVWKLD